MKRGKMAQAVAIATTLLLIVLACSFYFTSRSYLDQIQTITLPGENGGLTVGAGELGENADVVDGVAIHPENVKDVIRTLRRPAEYQYTALVTQSYHSLENQTQVTAAVKGERCRLRITPADGGQEKNIILTPDSYYAWLSSSSPQYYQGSRGEYSYDEAGGIPTYEDVLELEILEAGYTERDGKACIYVKAARPVDNAMGAGLMVEDTYYIAVSTGLLDGAESQVGGLTAYSMQQTAYQADSPAETEFVLPNGQTVQTGA